MMLQRPATRLSGTVGVLSPEPVGNAPVQQKYRPAGPGQTGAKLLTEGEFGKIRTRT